MRPAKSPEFLSYARHQHHAVTTDDIIVLKRQVDSNATAFFERRQAYRCAPVGPENPKQTGLEVSTGRGRRWVGGMGSGGVGGGV